jgi:hypothetical protein
MRAAGTSPVTRNSTRARSAPATAWAAGAAAVFVRLECFSLPRLWHSYDLALRLHEEPFVTAFPLGWRYECVWETGTRQDAELLLKVFRDVCCECAPAGCSGACELVLLPLQTILQIMDAVVEKARYQQKITAISVDAVQMQPPLLAHRSCRLILLLPVLRRLCPAYIHSPPTAPSGPHPPRQAHDAQNQRSIGDPLHYAQNSSGSRCRPLCTRCASILIRLPTPLCVAALCRLCETITGLQSIVLQRGHP